MPDYSENHSASLTDDQLATTGNATRPGQVDLTDDERRRFTALVEWSYAEEPFIVEPYVDSGRATLLLRGEIDAMALEEVRSLIDVIVDAGPDGLDVDLSNAAFVSVSAMLCLVDAARHLPDVTIHRPSATVRRIFELVDPDARLSFE